MGKKSDIEERIRFNQPFLKAFNYIKLMKGVTQAQLAEMIDCHSSLISAYKTGEKVVNADMAGRLARIKDGGLNLDYLLCKSDYMLLENIPQSEWDRKGRMTNPDYEAMKRDGRIQEESSIVSEPANDTYNNLPSWASNLIEIMSQQIKENEALHRELRQTIQEVNQLKIDLQTAINNLQK